MTRMPARFSQKPAFIIWDSGTSPLPNTIAFGGETINVMETPGHTAGHVSYLFPDSGILFAADTLFAIGCGRLLECKPPVMFNSLKRLAALPLETRVYCGHEYTQANARFALTVDPTNSALKERAASGIVSPRIGSSS